MSAPALAVRPVDQAREDVEHPYRTIRRMQQERQIMVMVFAAAVARLRGERDLVVDRLVQANEALQKHAVKG